MSDLALISNQIRRIAGFWLEGSMFLPYRGEALRPSPHVLAHLAGWLSEVFSKGTQSIAWQPGIMDIAHTQLTDGETAILVFLFYFI